MNTEMELSDQYLFDELRNEFRNNLGPEYVSIIDGVQYINSLKYKAKELFSSTQTGVHKHKSATVENQTEVKQKCTVINESTSEHIQMKSKSRGRSENYACSWSKISTSSKYKIIADFIEKIEPDRKKQKELKYLLTVAINEQKFNKNCDVEFDADKKELLKINKLMMDESGNYCLSN